MKKLYNQAKGARTLSNLGDLTIDGKDKDPADDSEAAGDAEQTGDAEMPEEKVEA